MRTRLSIVLAALLAIVVTAYVIADGTVTTPVAVHSATWQIASVVERTGSGGDVAGVSVTIYFFDGGGNVVQRQTHSLTGPEIVTFMTTTNSAVAGESGSQIKRRRQRVTKALIDLGKISNVTPE